MKLFYSFAIIMVCKQYIPTKHILTSIEKSLRDRVICNERSSH